MNGMFGNDFSAEEPQDIEDLLAQGLIVLTNEKEEIVGIVHSEQQLDALIENPDFIKSLGSDKTINVYVAESNTAALRDLIGPFSPN